MKTIASYVHIIFSGFRTSLIGELGWPGWSPTSCIEEKQNITEQMLCCMSLCNKEAESCGNCLVMPSPVPPILVYNKPT